MKRRREIEKEGELRWTNGGVEGQHRCARAKGTRAEAREGLTRREEGAAVPRANLIPAPPALSSFLFSDARFTDARLLRRSAVPRSQSRSPSGNFRPQRQLQRFGTEHRARPPRGHDAPRAPQEEEKRLLVCNLFSRRTNDYCGVRQAIECQSNQTFRFTQLAAEETERIANESESNII